MLVHVRHLWDEHLLQTVQQGSPRLFDEKYNTYATWPMSIPPTWYSTFLMFAKTGTGQSSSSEERRHSRVSSVTDMKKSTPPGGAVREPSRKARCSAAMMLCRTAAGPCHGNFGTPEFQNPGILGLKSPETSALITLLRRRHSPRMQAH